MEKTLPVAWLDEKLDLPKCHSRDFETPAQYDHSNG